MDRFSENEKTSVVLRMLKAKESWYLHMHSAMSQEMTKAKTIHASKKFRNRWPCQKCRVSAVCTDGTAVATAASLASFHCSTNSTSFGPVTFRATDPQISQHPAIESEKQKPKCKANLVQKAIPGLDPSLDHFSKNWQLPRHFALGYLIDILFQWSMLPNNH
ncbi:conserved hypothetical protein [Ricinus communis]|uniref:Uncharacterized protein n=1 Tax=Ricinus communis TaxID=3988 RepID=B9SWN2_RICCO|nr:conserved hypothetical protein [Ricinus communis]